MGCCTSLCERFIDALCWNVTLPELTGDAVRLILLALSLTALTVFYSIIILLCQISSLSATDKRSQV